MAEYGLYGAMVRHSLPLPSHLSAGTAPWLLGMHKKAKQTTSGDDNKMDDSSADVDVEREDLRSHSIASLRLKAKEHLQQQVHEVALIIMKKETEDDSKECEKDSVSFPASPRFCGRGDVTEGSTRPASASLPSPFRSGSPAACEQGVCERD